MRRWKRVGICAPKHENGDEPAKRVLPLRSDSEWVRAESATMARLLNGEEFEINRDFPTSGLDHLLPATETR